MESLYKKVKGIFIGDLVVIPVFIIALIILFTVGTASAVASSSDPSSYSAAAASTSVGVTFIIAILLYVLLALYFLISTILKIVIYVQTSKHQSLKETNIPLLFLIGLFVPIVWYVGAFMFIKEYKRL